MEYELEKIKSRANHIEVLLTDKKKLLKEKELSMLVRKKMKEYEKNKISEFSKQSYSSDDYKDPKEKINPEN